MNSSASATRFRSPLHPGSRCAYFTTQHPRATARLFHPPGLTILLCHCFSNNVIGGAGISTCCPSSTAFALDLGPDLPWADEPSPGNLRLSMAEFLTLLALLIPAFSLVCSPPPLSIRLLPAYIAPLPITSSVIPKLRCQVLAPLIFGASSLDQ